LLIVVARALGPERTRDELIPFIGESIDDEDSVVLVYAEKLGELVDYVGGSHYCYKLLETLGQLCAAEEAVVRDMTICSLEKVVVLMSEEHLEKYFVPLVVKLATKEWYTCRASAACLVHLAYCKLSDERRASFRSMFVKLCADETPIVRKLAARNLGRVSYEIIKLDQLPQDFIRTFTQLASDDQDAVRIENIMNGVALSELLAVEQKVRRCVYSCVCVLVRCVMRKQS
jgi:serine/threonine-protein phosphatase 2A regulatory subunit A